MVTLTIHGVGGRSTTSCCLMKVVSKSGLENENAFDSPFPKDNQMLLRQEQGTSEQAEIPSKKGWGRSQSNPKRTGVLVDYTERDPWIGKTSQLNASLDPRAMTVHGVGST